MSACCRTEATDILMELSERHKDDAIIMYNLAVLLAENAKYSAATKAVKSAMANSSGSFDPAWALYALILSAKYKPTVRDSLVRSCFQSRTRGSIDRD